MKDISVIILTFNEELNIDAAIDSVAGWAKQIFIVDSYSTDSTVDRVIHRADDNVRIFQNTFVNYSQQWNWALKNLPIKTQWTLKLDADERVTPEFKRETETLLRRDDLSGIYFRRKMFFMDEPIRHAGYSSTYVLHCWRTGHVKFEDRLVNEHPLITGKTQKIKAFIDHYNHKSITDWIEKHNRYASLEVRCIVEDRLYGDIVPDPFGNPEERRMWLRRIYRKLPLKQIFYFLYRYVFLMGFLDGRAGLRYCLLHAFYRYWIDLKYEEAQKSKSLPEVKWPVRGKPHPGVLIPKGDIT
jgi:glycosyltransferase involved in cell wall biosynthesis